MNSFEKTVEVEIVLQQYKVDTRLYKKGKKIGKEKNLH